MSEADDAAPKRKVLVIIDDTPECEQALLYAAMRARRTGATIVALCVAGESDFQHWMGVEQLMREEAEAEAQEMLDKALAKIDEHLAHEPERRIVIGNRVDGIRETLAADPAIAVLVLAAAEGSEGPGPLVSAIAAGQAGAFPVPITIVPGGLDPEAVKAIA